MKIRIFTAMFVVVFSSVFFSGAQALEKYEPEKGAYIGMVLDWADLATKGEGESSVERFANGMKAANDSSGKKHALFEQFIFFPHGAEWQDKKYHGKYATWDTDPCGWSTAKEFTLACDKVGATAVLTIEPYVAKDFYTDWKPGNEAYDNTLAFAKGCAEFKKPIFIRFAHEMNGSWYPWCSWLDKNLSQTRDPGEDTDVTPERYVTMFRNFSSLMKKHAPNVAIIWCPNQGWLGKEVQDLYTPYYPGDEYVDWVSLDFYERGWFMPMPMARLWGGQFTRGLEYDCLDDPKTKENESVNFYKTYCVEKNKPLMICETGATQTYRSDLTNEQRRDFSHRWKAHVWDKVNVGWIRAVYGTTLTKETIYEKAPIDEKYPMLKGIIWFNQGKPEMLPAVKKKGKKEEVVWFKFEMTDYRIGWNAYSEETKYDKSNFFQDEIDTYKNLINNSYFLSEVVDNS